MIAALTIPLTLASRLLNAARGGSIHETLCFASLRPDAPGWLLILAAAAEYFHCGHLAWSTDIDGARP